ncbi:hypothetical protein [uncultured Pseudoteredinibacter sp.]|uniref:hypothetical protein n=1 Tax=uncultured Pseudoteredinibacter sp. TaxID=1641701 RepID=UPI002607CB77|nr:hypothetical protein [uncultured Pseudoteredinibacter sp.]
MDPQKLLAKHNIHSAELELICQQFESRVAEKGLPRQAKILLETAAVDLALGAIEMSQETESAMGESLSAVQLLEILCGLELAS